MITNLSIQHRWSVMQFVSAEHLEPLEIHRKTVVVCGEKCLLKTFVTDWSRMFHDFRKETADSERQDQAHKVLTETVIPYIHTAV